MTDSFDRRTPRPASPLYSLRYATLRFDTRVGCGSLRARGLFRSFPLDRTTEPTGRGGRRGAFLRPCPGQAIRDATRRRRPTRGDVCGLDGPRGKVAVTGLTSVDRDLEVALPRTAPRSASRDYTIWMTVSNVRLSNMTRQRAACSREMTRDRARRPTRRRRPTHTRAST